MENKKNNGGLKIRITTLADYGSKAKKTGEKTIKLVKIDELLHAPWNPRTPEEMSPENPEIIKLAASMRENGQLEPIGVWENADFEGDGFMRGDNLVIYGNRRVEAAKLAGMSEIHAVVWTGLTVEEAKAKTREENENRLGVSALQDARIVKEMISGGMTQREVAARTGMSEAMICRRAKLFDLDVGALGGVESAEKFDTKSLELIASLAVATQKRLIDSFKYRLSHSSHISFSEVNSIYRSLTAKIDDDDWLFEGDDGRERLNKCRACGMCTGSQPMLFDDDEVKENRCLNSKCLDKMRKSERLRRIENAVKETGGNVQSLRVEKWEHYGPMQDLKAKKATKKSNFAFVYFDDSTGKVTVKYGEDPKIAEIEERRKLADDKAAREIENKRRREHEELEKSGCKKIMQHFLGAVLNDDDARPKDYDEEFGLDFTELSDDEMARCVKAALDAGLRDAIVSVANRGAKDLVKLLLWDLSFGDGSVNKKYAAGSEIVKVEELINALFSESAEERTKAALELFTEELTANVCWCRFRDADHAFYQFLLDELPALNGLLTQEEIVAIA